MGFGKTASIFLPPTRFQKQLSNKSLTRLDRRPRVSEKRCRTCRSTLTSYAGRHAELYDLFYAEKPYEAEAAFVGQCLREYSTGPTNKLLEIACGTGTHALQLEKRGYQILATDYSVAMLER